MVLGVSHPGFKVLGEEHLGVLCSYKMELFSPGERRAGSC